MKRPTNPNARFLIVIAILSAVVLASAASWTLAKSKDANRQAMATPDSTTTIADNAPAGGYAKAELAVDNLSCGGCIETIKTSLRPLPGIGNVSVDIASGSADVYYDADRLKNPDRIATTITNAGYPAKIERLVSAKQVGEALELAAVKARTAIASVGQQEIPRQDYMAELSHARSRYEAMYGPDVFAGARGSRLLAQVKAQIATRLVSEHIKLQEVDRSGYRMPAERVEQAMQAFLNERRTTVTDFQRDLKSNGYDFIYFKKKFAQRVRLQSYLDERILSDSIDPDDRQQRYANWLANARALAKVVYYDKEIESLIQSAGSGGCSGGSCSASR